MAFKRSRVRIPYPPHFDSAPALHGAANPCKSGVFLCGGGSRLRRLAALSATCCAAFCNERVGSERLVIGVAHQSVAILRPQHGSTDNST